MSPAHDEGREQEFFICGPDGKQRARNRAAEKPSKDDPEASLQRGDILQDPQIRGDRNSARIDQFKKRV